MTAPLASTDLTVPEMSLPFSWPATKLLKGSPSSCLISLGIKQLEGDPFNNFVAGHEKGKLISGTVKSVDAKGAVISLGGDLEGYLRASEIARDRVEDA